MVLSSDVSFNYLIPTAKEIKCDLSNKTHNTKEFVGVTEVKYYTRDCLIL